MSGWRVRQKSLLRVRSRHRRVVAGARWSRIKVCRERARRYGTMSFSWKVTASLPMALLVVVGCFTFQASKGETGMETMQTDAGRIKESGNVLFLILIAVALFAALSYAVTQSSRSGSTESTGEKSLISSSTLTQYPAGVRTDIIRMRSEEHTSE